MWLSRSSSRLLARRRLSTAVQRPTSITPQQRTALRAERRERGKALLAAAQGNASSSTSSKSLYTSRWIWYAGLSVPTILIGWTLQDSSSPPARALDALGVTAWIAHYTDQVAQPVYATLLPAWTEMPHVPHDIPPPPTLVLDLEETLVSSTWDRKHGWRHAKRPGVDQFLQTMANYYEIVLYSPSIDGVADPVVSSLDKQQCIMHRLYRDATYYQDGIHKKDISRLGRKMGKIVVLDDDVDAVLHPDHMICVPPYTDPTDRTDNVLERLTPFLVNLARQGYDDIPAVLEQYRGMDAVQIMDEQDIRRLRVAQNTGGLSSLGRRGDLPTPELTPTARTSVATKGLTSKDIVGAAPPPTSGVAGWMAQRAAQKEEAQQRKMQEWNQVMMDRQEKKKQQQQQAKAAA